MASQPKVRVLFVCIGNACRSPMAESIARKSAPDLILPSSAGLYPLGRIVEATEQALATNGYPIEDLFSKPLRRESMEEADVIINMTGGSLDRDFHGHTRDNPHLAEKVETWDIRDPYGADAATYQRILEEIESRIARLAERLRAEHGVASS